MMYLQDVTTAFINEMGEYGPEDDEGNSECDLYPGPATQHTSERTDCEARRACRQFIAVCEGLDPNCFDELHGVTVGELFYHARNGSGIGFFDCDAIESQARRDFLQTIARGFGECSLQWDGSELAGYEI